MMCVDDTCNILVAEGAATAATLRLLIGNDLEIQASVKLSLLSTEALDVWRRSEFIVFKLTLLKEHYEAVERYYLVPSIVTDVMTALGTLRE